MEKKKKSIRGAKRAPMKFRKTESKEKTFWRNKDKPSDSKFRN